MKRHVITIAWVALAGLFAGGCAGGGNSESPEVEATGTGAETDTAQGGNSELEQSEITVGVLPVVDYAAVYLAEDMGLFEAEGLDVTIEPVAGGAAAIPTLVAGETDVAIVNWVSFMYAVQEGLPITAVAEAVRATPGFTGIYVMPDSPIQGPEDLAGATVTTNQLDNIISLTTSVVADSLGVDSSSIDYLEMPLPNFVSAMADGTVDAAWLVEPLATVGKQTQDARLVMDVYQGPTEGLPVGGYAVTTEFAQQNPNTVAAFTRAIQAASEAADDEAVREILPSYTELTPELVDQVTLPQYMSEIDASALQRVADLMNDNGYLEQEIAASEHVQTP